MWDCLVPPHYKFFFCLVQTYRPNWLSSIPKNTNVCMLRIGWNTGDSGLYVFLLFALNTWKLRIVRLGIVHFKLFVDWSFDIWQWRFFENIQSSWTWVFSELFVGVISSNIFDTGVDRNSSFNWTFVIRCILGLEFSLCVNFLGWSVVTVIIFSLNAPYLLGLVIHNDRALSRHIFLLLVASDIL